MSVAPDRFASRHDTIVFVVCLLASVAGRMAPVALQEKISAAVRSTIGYPFLRLQEQIALMKRARVDYARVVAQRDSAFFAELRAAALEEENARLRAALELSQRLGVRHVAAEVLHQASPLDGYTLVLSAGRDDGVLPRAPVVAPGGLVGVVRSVDRRTAIAIMWAHPDFRVSAMTRDGSVFGIAAPAGASGPQTMLLELHGVPYGQRVLPGTTIYTSGLGGAFGVYPRGIPVGTVLSVADEQAGWARTYTVRPAVHPAAVTHVLILVGPGLDLTAGFAEQPE